MEKDEFFVDEDPSYLTMARICKAEWDTWKKGNVWGQGYTGFKEIVIENAYKAGFMAGFEARFFKQND